MTSRLDKNGGDSKKRKASEQYRSSKFLKEDDDVIELSESPIKSDDDRKYGDISSTSSSELESQLHDARDQLLYFNDDRDVPIFRSGKCTYTTEEIVKILWSANADLIKCKKGVRKCQRNAVFLIDLRYTSLEDLRADGLPQYDLYGGKRTLTVKVERPEDGDDAEVIITCRSKAKLKGNMYHFERLYHSWTLESGKKFHRRIMHMRDSRNDIVNNVAFVQYAFDGKEENVCEKPHRNTKKGPKVPNYTRTKASVVRNIDTNLTLMGPKEAVFQATREAGGVIKAESMSDLPRGDRQGYYRNSVIKASLPVYLQGKEKDDELLDVILKMKTEKEPFVRKVTLEKENVTIVLATENQLGDLARYSTSELDFSIVQLDPTFNLGSYECTPISYRKVMLRSKRSDASSVRLGPVLIHYRKDEKTFRHFLQTIVDEKPKLKEILSCGTDGETALINAIESVLPKADERSVRCFRHLQNNMQSALSSFGVPGRQRDYIEEVFGSIDKDGIYQAGLLDAESPEEFDATLQSLKQKWVERGDTSQEVYSWVSERGAMLKKRAIASVRRAARLQSMSPAVNIPVHFFTNDAESNNNKLKAKKGRKPSGFIGTIEAVKSIAEEEEEEFAQAIGGVSQKYDLRPEFVKFAVANFMKWKSDERAYYLQKLQKASMEQLYAAENPESLGLVPESVTRRQELTSVEDKSDMAPSHFDDSDFEGDRESADLSDDNEEVPKETIISGLTSLEEDDRLQHFSSRTRAGLTEKAKLLLSLNSVWRGPVTMNGMPSFSVTSQSGKRPNYVVLENAGKVECECTHWKATKICSHALAVAAKEDEIPSYLSWYGKQKMTTRKNLTNAANIHIKTSTLGNKGRRPKRQRSRRAPSAAIVENNGDRSKGRQYKLKWLKDTKAFKCFGCESAIRIPGEIPEAPDDVIASTNEYRSFMKDGKLQVHFGPTHYHLLSRCIVAKNANFNPQTHFTITDSDRRLFQEAHKRHLQKEFQI